MTKNNLLTLTASLAVALLAGCSSEAPKAPEAKKEAKPVLPVSGQSALFSMYQVARSWNGDALVLKLENIDIPEAKAQPGKYGAWKATFVSPEKRARRDYTYSVAESAGNIHKGVFPGGESSYIANPSERPFPIASVKIDTTEALENAIKQKDVEEFAAKNTDVPVQFVLEWSSLTPRPTWRVYWGATLSTSKASVFIDYEDGKFIKKLH